MAAMDYVADSDVIAHRKLVSQVWLGDN